MKLAPLTCMALVLAAAASHAADPQPTALRDPIPQRIAKGELAVQAVEFVRAPRTSDPAKGPGTNDAYARIQYLLPLPDGSGRLFFNDLRGVLYATDERGSEPRAYLDLREQAADFEGSIFPNETGLMGFAFHPDFGASGRAGYGIFYTAYSVRSESGTAQYLDDDAGSHESVIREWQASDPAAAVFSGSSREVFRVGHFARNHGIGTLGFNPAAARDSADFGKLYFSLGDGGQANDPREYGQSLREPLGAILRIDPLARAEGRSYGIPQDNPFAARAGAAPEIWAYGLRHPQQFSWDGEGRMFIADMGQEQVEEINLGVAGANYGWRLREGSFATAFGAGSAERPGPVYALPADPAQFAEPVAQYDHDEGNAVGSGFVYRGRAIPELVGQYVFADLARGRLFYASADALRPGEPAAIQELRVRFGGVEREILEVVGYPNTYRAGTLRADLRLGIDSAGELYLLTKGDGWVRKLTAVSAPAAPPGAAPAGD
jgi:glucose/arabinose dehydrogenase